MSTTTGSNPLDELDVLWTYVLIGGNHVEACRALRRLGNYVEMIEGVKEETTE